MSPSYEMLFETTIRSFLGEKAFHIAGQVHSKQSRKEWYRKVIKLVVKKVLELESNTKHQEQLSYWSERTLNSLKEKPFSETVFTLCLLRLLSTLLGFVGLRPYRIATPTYFQTPPQHYTEIILGGGDVMQDYYDEKSTLKIRKDLIAQLKSKGMTDFEISLVFNITEYQVKKLRKEL